MKSGPFTLIIPEYAGEYDQEPVYTHTHLVKDLKEASEVYKKIRDKSGNGSRLFGSGSIMKGSLEVAFVSYNGRVWTGSAKFEGGAQTLLLESQSLN